MIKELKPGEKITFVCVEDSDAAGGCVECVFIGCEAMCARLACYDCERTDGRNVHFELK